MGSCRLDRSSVGRASYRLGGGGRYDRGVRLQARWNAGFLCALALLAGVGLGGCAQPTPSPGFTFGAQRYAEVFQATKDTLREYEFELEQVDARGGVITTWPRQWAGLATPWIPQATDTESAVVGLIQHEMRSCRVTFAVVDPKDSHGDLRAATGEMTANVEVTIHRVQRPGVRIGAASVRMRSQAIDPRLQEEGLQPAYATPAGVDNALAGRIAEAIEKDPNAIAADWDGSATPEE